MQELTDWTELFINSFRVFGERFMGAIPGILGAVLIFLVGWLFAKLVSGGIARLLKLMKFDGLAQKAKTEHYLKKANINLTPTQIVGKFVYWILLILVLITASDTLGWTTVSSELSRLLAYLPNLLIAIVIFIIGTYIAAFIRDVIAGATTSLGISSGKIVSSFVFYLLFIVIALTAMKQAGIDTSIISNNLLLILGAILTAAAISYGLASKDVLSNILAGYFSRHSFKEGMEIEVEGIRGIIVSRSNIGITITKSDDERVIIPTKSLINQKVHIYNESD
ncbi:MAG: mechanosensitive ion channel [Saprospiraceae bacterium]|nr:mechanosensitive ion channel [Saprospiraceae bacterium]